MILIIIALRWFAIAFIAWVGFRFSNLPVTFITCLCFGLIGSILEYTVRAWTVRALRAMRCDLVAGMKNPS